MDPTAATSFVGIGAAIAAVVGVIKQVAPDFPSRFTPLIVVALASLFIVVGAFAGHGSLDPYQILMNVVAQAASAMGMREGAVAVAPAISGKPTAPAQ